MLSNPWKSSLVLESDTCRTEIPLNPDGSVKWFDDSKLVRHKEPEKRNTTFAKRILKALCGKDESEAELTYSIICYLHGTTFTVVSSLISLVLLKCFFHFICSHVAGITARKDT